MDTITPDFNLPDDVTDIRQTYKQTNKQTNKQTSKQTNNFNQGTVEDYPPEALVDTITPDFSLPDDVTDITKDSDTVDETSSGTVSVLSYM